MRKARYNGLHRNNTAFASHLIHDVSEHLQLTFPSFLLKFVSFSSPAFSSIFFQEYSRGQGNTIFQGRQTSQRKWHLIDARGEDPGPRCDARLRGCCAGSTSRSFTPNADLGDFVVVVNASKIKLTGKRSELKEYFHYTGYPGGATLEKFQDIMRKNPERVFEHAVKGMLPHNRLGRQIIKKMKVYAGPEHPHVAQQPEAYSFNNSSEVGDRHQNASTAHRVRRTAERQRSPG